MSMCGSSENEREMPCTVLDEHMGETSAETANEREMPYILPNERIDDLQFNGLRIIQATDSFRFGTDSVLLAGFAQPKRTDECIDLGAGSGVLSILLNERTGCRMTAVEADAAQCGRLERSIGMNGQTDELRFGRGIRVLHADYIKNTKQIGLCCFDSAVCNPPYFRRDCGEVPAFGTATHELTADIGSVARAASALLKFGGKLFICFPSFRLSEAFVALSMAGVEPKRLRLVSVRAEKAPYLALIEAKKGARSGLIIEKPLMIHSENGEYTDEVKEIYHE